MSRFLLAGCLALCAAGCVSVDRNVELPGKTINSTAGYRGHLVEGQKLDDTLFIVTFSGGGTRAAALAQGAMRELDAISIGGGRTLLDEVDVVSSVSGGSVAAANFVVNGREGFDKFETNFVRKNFMPELIDAFINPINIVRYSLTSESRIDRLVEIFKPFYKVRTPESPDGTDATFATLMADKKRPFLMLNAADMTTAERFTFTQNQFDLICSDLSAFTIAEAVAASAAFPVGLTPITLKNHSRCADPDRALARVRYGINDRIHSGEIDPGPPPEEDPDPKDGVKRSNADTLFVAPAYDHQGSAFTARARGLKQGRMTRSPLTSEKKDFIHLADGGIADNLGLGAVLRDIWTSGEGGAAVGYGNLENIKHVVILVVNARADQKVKRDESSSPPGIIDMIWTSIGSAIDNRSSGLVDDLTVLTNRLDELKRNGTLDHEIDTNVAIVDFDRIRTADCRYKFAHTPTNWGLEDYQVFSLMEMASAMVRGSPAIQKLAKRAGGTVEMPPDAYAGQHRALQACKRMDAGEDGPYPKPTFGFPEP